MILYKFKNIPIYTKYVNASTHRRRTIFTFNKILFNIINK